MFMPCVCRRSETVCCVRVCSITPGSVPKLKQQKKINTKETVELIEALPSHLVAKLPFIGRKVN